MPTQLEILSRLTLAGPQFPARITTPEELLAALKFTPSGIDPELKEFLGEISKEFGQIDLSKLEMKLLKIPQTFIKGSITYV